LFNASNTFSLNTTEDRWSRWANVNLTFDVQLLNTDIYMSYTTVIVELKSLKGNMTQVIRLRPMPKTKLC